MYGSNVDLQLYRIYDKKGEAKRPEADAYAGRKFHESRYADIDYYNEYYLPIYRAYMR